MTFSILSRSLLICFTATLLLTLCACTFYKPRPVVEEPKALLLGTDAARQSQRSMLLTKRTYDAVDTLMERSQLPMLRDQALVVASLVSVNDVEKSSPLGRIMTEQISGRLVQLGFVVHEPKFRNSIAIKESGELILSRNPEHLKGSLDIQATVSGTYATGKNSVLFNLKLIEPSQGRVISSVDFSLPALESDYPDVPHLLKE